MSAEYLRNLRTCFLELHRHEVFSTDRNLAYQEYLESSALVGKITPLVMGSGWVGLFFAHRFFLAARFPNYRVLRPLLVVSVGVGLSVCTHLWLYSTYLLEPLNRVSLMYEKPAREMCPELKEFPQVSEVMQEPKETTLP